MIQSFRPHRPNFNATQYSSFRKKKQSQIQIESRFASESVFSRKKKHFSYWIFRRLSLLTFTYKQRPTFAFNEKRSFFPTLNVYIYNRLSDSRSFQTRCSIAFHQIVWVRYLFSSCFSGRCLRIFAFTKIIKQTITHAKMQSDFYQINRRGHPLDGIQVVANRMVHMWESFEETLKVLAFRLLSASYSCLNIARKFNRWVLDHCSIWYLIEIWIIPYTWVVNILNFDVLKLLKSSLSWRKFAESS